jgi:hypothetical protein
MTRPTLAHVHGFPGSVVIVAGAALVGCAEAPPPALAAQPPPVASSRERSPADEEMLALSRSEDEIDRLFPEPQRRLGGTKRGPTQDDASNRRDAPAKEAPTDLAPAGAGVASDGCSTACKALGSMASSADRLCRLAGENDGRCDDARARVRGAAARVKSSCPSCVVAAAPPPAVAPGMQAPPAGPAPGMPGSTKP